MSRVSSACSLATGHQSRELVVHEALRSPTTWHGVDMPTCLYDNAAADVVSQVDETFNVEPSVKIAAAHYRVMCHVWRYVLFSTIITWTFWIVFPYLNLCFGVCDEGMSRMHEGLMLLYAPVVAISLFFEMKVFAAKLPLLAAFLGGYKILGFNVPFSVYYFGLMVMSFVARMDVATNSITYARILHSSSCEGSEVERLWSVALKPSFLPIERFGTLATIAYYLMALQLLYGLVGGVPLFTNDSTRVKGLQWWLCVGQPDMVSYYAITLKSWPEEVWVPELISSLGFVSRMSSIAFQDGDLFDASDGAQLRDNNGADPWTRAAVADRARLQVIRLLLSTCLEGALFLLVQCFELSLRKAIDGKIDDMVLLSIALSCGTSAVQVIESTRNVMRIVCDLWPELTDDRLSETDLEWQAKNYTEMNRSSLKSHIIRTICCLSVSVMTFVLLTGAVVTMAFMIHECESGIWRPAWPLRDGCVVAPL